MARPAKQEISYFPVEVNLLHDRKVRKLRRQFGSDALSILITLYCLIYGGEGCYLELDQDALFDISEYVDLSEERVSEVICGAVECGLFDADFFTEHKILTSEGIRDRYDAIKSGSGSPCRSSQILQIITSEKPPITLEKPPITSEKPPITFEKLGVISEKPPVTRPIIPQIKEKEIKEKKSKHNARAREEIVENSEITPLFVENSPAPESVVETPETSQITATHSEFDVSNERVSYEATYDEVTIEVFDDVSELFTHTSQDRPSNDTNTYRLMRKEVIDHLNKRCSTHFDPNTKIERDVLNALFAKGYTTKQAIQVIDAKYKSWGQVEKMRRYLRPSTLFGSKFYKYLHQSRQMRKEDHEYASLT